MSTPTAAHGALPEAGERSALIQAVTLLLAHVEDVVDDDNWQRIDTKTWNKVTRLVAIDRAALSPASPAPAVPVSWRVGIAGHWEYFHTQEAAQRTRDAFEQNPGGEPEEHELAQPVYATPAQQTQSDAVAGAADDELVYAVLDSTGKRFAIASLEENARYAAREPGAVVVACRLVPATPPQQATPSRQPLTDAQIEDLRGEANRGFDIEREDYFKAFRDAEAAHGIGATPSAAASIPAPVAQQGEAT